MFHWLVDGLLGNRLPAMIACPLLISAVVLLALAYTEGHRGPKGPRLLAEEELGPMRLPPERASRNRR